MNIEDWMPLLYRTWKTTAAEKNMVVKEKPLVPPRPGFRDQKGQKRPAGRFAKPEEPVVQGQGRAYPSEGELFGLGDSVKRLSRGFTGYRNKVGSLYLDDPDMLGSYLLYYWPISYMQARWVLAGLTARGLPLPSRILDCGSGPGPVAFALADAKREQDPSAKIAIRLLDHSKGALDMAKALAVAAYGKDADTMVSTAVWDATKAKTPVELEASFTDKDGSWNSISFGHSLNELWKDKTDVLARRGSLLAAASKHLSDTGMVFIIEPALRDYSDSLIKLRDTLVLAKHPILAPCSFEGACPALAAGQTCHGQTHIALPRTVQKLASLAGLEKDSVAMSYLVFGAATKPWPANNDWYRVVSESMLNKAGRTRYMICGQKGRVSFSGKLPPDLKSASTGEKLFAVLKRDEVIRVYGCEDREGGIGLLKESSIVKI
jgi:ribosomal protein RSM22 (predicted rRNA methylase)